MRLPRGFAIAAVAYALASCAEQTVMIGDVRVYGLVREVSVADLNAAINADRAVNPGHIYAIEVWSSDYMRIYHEPASVAHASFDIMKRVGGKWRYCGTPVIVG
jgi:hypothetical protein